MMAYNQQPQQQYSETSTEMKFAVAVFVAVAGWYLADQLAGLSSMAAFDWIILLRAVAVGLFASGIAYALALVAIKVAPGLPALLLKKAEDVTGIDLDGKPNLPTGQPKRETRRMESQPVVRQPLQVEVLPLEDEADLFEELPQWIINTDKMVWGDRLNINGHLLDIPAGFNTEWLYTVAEKRAAGELETLSLRALDDIKISRWGNGNSSPAAQLINVLEESGCIQSRGTNQPYDWTEGGRKAFPSPTP